jgi:hypothetical protein
MAIAGVQVQQALGPDRPAYCTEAGLPGRRRHAGPVFTEDAQILRDWVNKYNWAQIVTSLTLPLLVTSY